MKTFKPQLLPNNPAGEEIDWHSLLSSNIQDYLCSLKHDGARVELQYDTAVKGRSLKTIPNVHIQRMHDALQSELGPYGGILEAEFYSPGMTFSEIMHFFKTEDVTSESTKEKYHKLWEKTKGDPEKGWKYPGRSVEWLTTWHDSLKFYVFDYYLQDGLTKLDRYKMLQTLCLNKIPVTTLVRQFEVSSVDELLSINQKAIENDYEGLVIIHKDAPYKFGRHTLNSGYAYKLKDDNVEFDGVILDVEESTVMREGAEKTINELGRSVTSKLKEDRIPSGMAKGFLVKMEDGNELTVSLKGYTHDDLRSMLDDKNLYIGKWIKFTGMPPVKPGGCPRSSHFTRGNMRDEK